MKPQNECWLTIGRKAIILQFVRFFVLSFAYFEKKHYLCPVINALFYFNL